jgi:hypothetical protein
VLKEKLEPLGIECVLRHADDYRGDPAASTRDMVEFFARHFRNGKP